MNSSTQNPSNNDDVTGSRSQPPRLSQEVTMGDEQDADHLWSPIRTEIPTSGLGFSWESIAEPELPVQTEKVQKRASNVMKLTQEHEKLKAELKAMSDRLEAAEKRRQELEKEKARRNARF
ncbi:hypothetical protein CCMSSC00406_0003240 [Pleurotus cornucopiae]|uniref:Uncharacterized protein n=1 Tax=Pleurotus cornucopiae TaxID=5321 RepID=A0ACB7J8G2_PLECO|nr:hypothetical protein CCMSSC00406_0003240 [Pleurotus cornucopiae]